MLALLVSFLNSFFSNVDVYVKVLARGWSVIPSLARLVLLFSLLWILLLSVERKIDLGGLRSNAGFVDLFGGGLGRLLLIDLMSTDVAPFLWCGASGANVLICHPDRIWLLCSERLTVVEVAHFKGELFGHEVHMFLLSNA